MRILERVLAQDATPEDKLGQMAAQLKVLDDWAQQSQSWMAKAEKWIHTAATVFDRIDVRIGELDDRETETKQRVEHLETKPPPEAPPGLAASAETAEKLAKLEVLEAKLNERFEQVELAAATTQSDLGKLVERLDTYTRQSEDAVTAQLKRVDVGMDRLERGLRDLDRVDSDVKATVDTYHTAHGVQLKEMEAMLRQHDLQLQAAGRKPTGRWSSTTRGTTGEEEKGSGKKDQGDKDEQRLPVSFPEWLFEGDCHCVHVTDLLADCKELQDKELVNNVRLRSLDEVVTQLRGDVDQLTKQAREAPAGLGRDPWQPTQPSAATGAPSSAAAQGFVPSHGPGSPGNLYKLFDSKVAAVPEYRWKGDKESGQKWKAKVRAYFISAHPDMKKLLDWSEKRDYEVISEADLMAASAGWMMDNMAKSLSQQMWGFLSQCLTDTAWTFFMGAEELNGADAWRRVTLVIEEGRPRVLEELREKVKNPESIRDLQNIGLGIENFVKNITEFRAAGGRGPDEEEMKSDLLNLLPLDLQEALMWHADDKSVSFEKYRAHIQTTANKVLKLRSKRRGLHMIAPDEFQDYGEDDQKVYGETVSSSGEQSDVSAEELLAVAGQMGYVRNPRGRFQKQPPQRPGGGAAGRTGGAAGPKGPGLMQRAFQTGVREQKCVNCAGSGHRASECPRPTVPVEQRPCFKCGKPGCRSNRCGKAPGGAPRAAKGPGSINFFGCLEYEKPAPRTATMGDAIAKAWNLKNRFGALRASDDDENEDIMCEASSNSSINISDFSASFSSIRNISNACGCCDRNRSHLGSRPFASGLTAATDAVSTALLCPTSVRKSSAAALGDSTKPEDVDGELQNIVGKLDNIEDKVQEVGDMMANPGEKTTNIASAFSDPDEAKENGGYYMKTRWNPSPRPSSHDSTRIMKPKCTQQQCCGVTGVIGIPSDELLSETPRRSKAQDGINMLFWEQEEDLLMADDTIKVEVAMDSGAIAHVTPPDCVPRGVEVDEAKVRNFTAANGGSIKNYGKARVAMTDKFNAESECVYNVADVTRTLHSTGQIADQGFEILYTKHGCAVVPEGLLSQHVKDSDIAARYPRRNGGLYVAEFTVTAPKPRAEESAIDPGFARQGVRA